MLIGIQVHIDTGVHVVLLTHYIYMLIGVQGYMSIFETRLRVITLVQLHKIQVKMFSKV